MFKQIKLKPIKGYVLTTTVKYNCDCCDLEDETVTEEIFLTEEARDNKINQVMQTPACFKQYKKSCKILYTHE